MIKGYTPDWSVIREYLPVLMHGVVLTLRLSVLSTGVAIIVGLFAGLCRISKNPVVSFLAAAYVEFLRGIPLLVFLMFIYFGLGSFVELGSKVAAVLGLGIFSGAFVAEIVRAGIQSIPRGQMEAARSSGMTYFQAMRLIILPQALRRILPPLAGQFIFLIKDSSLVSVISEYELTLQARNAIIASFRSFELWTFTAFLYFAMTFTLSQVFRAFERRFRVEH